jgi:hypothetical protein
MAEQAEQTHRPGNSETFSKPCLSVKPFEAKRVAFFQICGGIATVSANGLIQRAGLWLGPPQSETKATPAAPVALSEKPPWSREAKGLGKISAHASGSGPALY